jgi:predicted transport protein
MDQATQTMIRNMPEKTGKSLEQWLPLVKKAKLEKHGQIVKFLKTEHGVGHGFANLIAYHALNSSVLTDSGDDLVAAQYAGPKAELKPIYDKLEKAVKKFGKDVEISPKKTYVSLRRSKQFALVQPSTKTRVDVGINLKGKPAKGRLEKSGSFNAMVSHRVRLESVKDVDAELVGLLREAYNAS